LVPLEKLKQIRPYVVVGAFVVAAVVTPPYIMSQLLLAVPLCLLYEVGLFCGTYLRACHQGTGRCGKYGGIRPLALSLLSRTVFLLFAVIRPD